MFKYSDGLTQIPLQQAALCASQKLPWLPQVQAPLVQEFPCWQTCPQLPQLAVVFSDSCPSAQTQSPFTQCCPCLQVFPHDPQLLSVVRAMHFPPQQV